RATVSGVLSAAVCADSLRLDQGVAGVFRRARPLGDSGPRVERTARLPDSGDGSSRDELVYLGVGRVECRGGAGDNKVARLVFQDLGRRRRAGVRDDVGPGVAARGSLKLDT